MTPEEAKTILSTSRVDQLDTDNPDVRQALALVSTNPQLAAWWEAEQAFDRAFARKLTGITAPTALQEAILQGGATIFAARQLITETKTDAINEELIEKNTPPLVENVVPFHQSTADIQALAGDAPAAARRAWPRYLPWSLAASLLVGLLAISLFMDASKVTAHADEELPAFTQFAETASDTGAPPEKYSQQMSDLQTYLASRQAPTTDTLPPEVGAAKIVGESVEHWKKDTISLVRLQDPTGNISLFILNRTDFPDDTVSPTPAVTQDPKDTVTTWTDDKNIYVMVRANSPASH
jgi:hypothetical protein